MATDQTYIEELTESNEKLHKQLSALRSELVHWRFKWILINGNLSEVLKERDKAMNELAIAQAEAASERGYWREKAEAAHKKVIEQAELLKAAQAERDYWVEFANQKANLLNAARSELDTVKSRLVDCYRGKRPPEAVADLLIAVNDIEAAWGNLLEVLAKYGYKRE